MKILTVSQTIGNGGHYKVSNAMLTASELTLAAATYTLGSVTATATLENCVLGANSVMTMVGSGGALELLQISGSTTNNGVIDVVGGTAGAGTRTGSRTDPPPASRRTAHPDAAVLAGL